MGHVLTGLLAATRLHTWACVTAEGFILYASLMHSRIAGGCALLPAPCADGLLARTAAPLNPVAIMRGAA